MKLLIFLLLTTNVYAKKNVESEYSASLTESFMDHILECGYENANEYLSTKGDYYIDINDSECESGIREVDDTCKEVDREAFLESIEEIEQWELVITYPRMA